MKRGDIVTIALQGDYGKPRPALVIQSDLFDQHPSVTVIPLTTDLRRTPLFRLPVEPAPQSGLRQRSQLMIDKLQTVPRNKVGQVLGQVAPDELIAANRALLLFLGLV